MRSLLLVTALSVLASCSIGKGKIPNLQWEPTVETVLLEPEPSSFVEDGLRFEIQKLTRVNYTTYGVVRNVQERGQYFDLEIRVEEARDRSPRILRNAVRQVEFRILDDNGKELSSSRGAIVTIDEQNSTGIQVHAQVRLQFDGGLPAGVPASLAVGRVRLPL